jgi:hypothetical protein
VPMSLSIIVTDTRTVEIRIVTQGVETRKIFLILDEPRLFVFFTTGFRVQYILHALGD